MTSAGDQLEGRRPVLEALRAGRAIRRILVSGDARDAGALGEITAAAARRGVPVQRVPRQAIETRARSRTPQGVIAIVEAFAFSSLGEALEAAERRDEPALLVALDSVTDPHNIGAIARSAEASGAHGLLLPQRRTASVTPAVEKAAAGALSFLPVVQIGNLSAALKDLKDRGVWIVSLDASGAEDIWTLPVATEPVCIVVGAEGGGVSRLVRERSDVVARIPLAGQVSSLNASVAAAVALFEIRRRRRT